MSESIQSGSTFAEATGQHPRLFNKLYVNMVKAGEVGGVLNVVLERLADFMEKAERIKSKVKGAMIYPIVVLAISFIILTLLMIFVIPKFEEIFSDMLEGESLPAITQVVINTSTNLGANLPIFLGGLLGVAVLFKFLKRFASVQYVLDRIALNLPIFGTLVRKTSVSRFARTLGTLMSAGVPILQALNIVRDTAGNSAVARAIHSVHDGVKEGENMAPPLEASGVFPPMVISMVEVGEETGELPAMLLKVADAYDGEVDDVVAGLTSLIEPILIVFLAGIVGTIVVALFLPLTTVLGKLGGG